MPTVDVDRIPIVDLTPLFGDDGERVALAEQLRAICHDIGFFVVVGHRIPTGLIDTVFDMMRRFFALPDEQKALIDKRESRHFRGWEAVGAELTNNRPDIREQIDVWTEAVALDPDVEPRFGRLVGPNQWMPDELLPAHRAISLEWFDRLAGLADRLLGVLSIGLGLDEHHLRGTFGDASMSLAKFISYPPTPAGAAGVNPHHDTGFLTLLAAGSTPGLQVLDPTGGWVDVPIVPNSFVVNLGEMLQAMTGNYFVATAHRVIAAEARLSTAYFHGPSLETRLDPLPLAPEFHAAVAASERHASAGYMASREQTVAGVGDMQSAERPAVYGEQLWNYFARSYPDNVARHYG